MKNAKWFRKTVLLFWMSLFFIPYLSAGYLASCPQCGWGYISTGPKGLSCRGHVYVYGCGYHIPAADVLAAITLGSLDIQLPSQDCSPLPRVLQTQVQNLPPSEGVSHGRTLTQPLASHHKQERHRFYQTSHQPYVQSIITTEAMASLFSSLYDQLPRGQYNSRTLGSAAQLAIIQYLFLTGSTPSADHEQIDMAVRIWLLFQYWLNKLAQGFVAEAATHNLLEMAVEGIIPLDPPDLEQMLQAFNSPEVAAPLDPNDVHSSIRSLVQKIRQQAQHSFAFYQVPFFGVLAVYHNNEGTVYVATSNNTLIEIQNAAQELEPVLSELITLPQQQAYAQHQQTAAAAATQAAIQANLAHVPEFHTLTEEEWQQSSMITGAGFLAGYLAGTAIAGRLSLASNQQFDLACSLAVVGATAGAMNSPAGILTIEHYLARMWNAVTRWTHQNND